MTENEILKCAIHCIKVQDDFAICQDCEVFKKSISENDMDSNCDKVSKSAIKALEEVQEYRKIGTVEECQEAVEKTKSKKAVEILGTYGEIYECPECGSELTDMDLFAGHCKWCGQKVRKND